MNITIVTATLNRRPLLKRALASVARQRLEGIQHVVVDGGSTDGTLEMLAGFPHLEVISEPDRNLYDAWNKGIARAHGDFVFLLNSDDEVAEGAFTEALRIASLHPGADIISGPVALTRERGTSAERTAVIGDPRIVGLREQDIGPGVPLTNGRFLSRRLVECLGGFDIRYPVIADRQFLLRALAAGAVNATTDRVVYRYNIHDASLTLNDRPPSIAYAQECLQAVVDGLAEARDPVLRAFYRRWHSWAMSYLAVLELLSSRHPAQAFKTVFAGLMRDPLLPARVLPQVARHLAERQARRGLPSFDEADPAPDYWHLRAAPTTANAVPSDTGPPPLR